MKYLRKIIPVLFLTLIALAIVGHNRDKYHSNTPVEYVVSTAEGLDSSPRGIFRRAWRLVKNNYVDSTLNHQDWSRWKDRYETLIDDYDDSYLAIQTMLESLNDPYTKFLTRENFEEQNRNIDSKLQGIGVHITEIFGNVVIISVIEGSPAQKSGLKQKDEILKVGSVTVKGLSLGEVAELIRGEAGTQINLTILRDDRVLQKKITREEIKIRTVKYELLPENIAYIRITSFISHDTANEFRNALIKARNADGIIIDVRGNYGGLLTNAVYITNMFLESGNIVSIVDRNGKKQEFPAIPGSFTTEKQIAILIDEASASASEIFSGALKDHKRAFLVGERTFGKGKVQMIIKLPDESGINLTVARYLTPSGQDIDNRGISPDYKVESDTPNFFGEEEDECLDKAIRVLLQNVK